MVPEPARLWAPNRLKIRIASLILLETLVFIVFLYKFPFKMLNFGHNFGQNFRPSKTNLNSGRAVLCSLNCPSNGTPNSSRTKKQRHTKKTITRRNPTLLSAERSAFGEKRKKTCFFLALDCWPWPFCGQRPVRTTTQTTL